MISHSGFHQRIINKYQKGKSNPFRFPMMIFYKNTEHNISRNIVMNILLQLHFHNLNILPSFIVQSAQNMERLFSWFRTEKLKTVHSLNKMFLLIQSEIASRLPPAVHKLVNRVSLVRSGQPGLSWSGSMSFTVTKLLQSLYSTAAYTISSPNFTVNRQLSNYDNDVQIVPEYRPQVIWPQVLQVNLLRNKWMKSINVSENTGHYHFTQKGNVREHHFILRHKSLAILPQIRLLLNNRSTKVFHNWITAHKPSIQAYYDHPEANIANFETSQRRTIFTTDSEHFYFRKQHTIEQEVEEIKKIVVETKEVVADKSQAPYPPIDVEIKKHLDLNRLSDQVYQNIERRIRIERERRGL